MYKFEGMNVVKNFITGGFLLLIVPLTIGFSCKKESRKLEEVQVKFITSSEAQQKIKAAEGVAKQKGQKTGGIITARLITGRILQSRFVTGRMITAGAPRLSQKDEWVALVTAPVSITEEGGGLELISALPASEGRWEIDIKIFIGTLDEDFRVDGTIIAKGDKILDLNAEDVEKGKKEDELSLNFDIDSDGDTVSNIEEILVRTNPSDSSECPLKVWYRDADSDGYTDGATKTACAPSPPYNLTSITALDCNDSNSSIYPGAPLNCNNGRDNDCSGNIEKWAYTDSDGDRHAPNSISFCVDTFQGKITVGLHLSTSDCNDSNSSIYPGAPLNCNNGRDNDCSGVVESWFFQDQDSDSWTTSVSQCANTMPSGFTSVSKSSDCNDNNPTINPSAPNDNTCDSVDNNCNGYVDESTRPCFAPSLAISSWGLTYVTLSWSYQEPPSNVENFVIEKSHNGITFTTPQVLSGFTTSYTDTYLNTKHRYRIYAKNVAGSEPSSVTSVPFGVSSTFEKTIGGVNNDFTSSIIQSSDGGFVVAGETSSFGAGGDDIYIVKLDSSGEVLWDKTFGGVNDDAASSIIQSKDGGFVVAGYTQSFGAGGSDFYIVKLDSSGEVLWTKTFGGVNDDAASSIIQSKDGGFVVAGYTQSFGAGGSDFYIVKLDKSGNVIWTKTFGGSSNDVAYSIIQSKDGGFVVAGHTRSFGAGNYDFYIVKLDSSGKLLWTKTIGGRYDDTALSIIQSKDGGFIVAGFTYSFGAGGADIYIVKLDSLGNVLWTKTVGGSNDDYAYSIIQSSDGGFVVAGFTYSFGAGGADIYIVKLDSSGEVLWTKTFGGVNDDVALSVLQSKDGRFVVAGFTYSFGLGGADLYIVKLDSSVLWTKTFGGTSTDVARSIIQSKDGGFVVAGYTQSFGVGYSDIYIVKLDSLGKLLWTKTIGGSRDDKAYSIIQSKDGGFVIAGGTRSFDEGGEDIYIVKLDKSGNILWTKTFGGVNDDVAYSIIQSKDGGFVVAGYTRSFGEGEGDFYIVKLDSSGEVLWDKTFGGINDDVAYSIIQSKDGGFVVAGGTGSFGAGGADIYIVKLDSSGEVVWGKTFGGSFNDIALSIIQSKDGGFVVAGFTQSFGEGNPDLYIIKLDSSGEVSWSKTIGGSSTDVASSIIQSKDGGFVVAGYTRSFGAGEADIYVVKLDSSGEVLWTKTFGGSSNDVAYSIIQSKDGGFVVAGGTRSFGAGKADFYIVKLDSSGEASWPKTIGRRYDDKAHSIIRGFVVAGDSFCTSQSDFYIVKPGLSFDTCWSRGSATSQTSTTNSISLTDSTIFPTVSSVMNICVSQGATGLPMCYLPGSCDHDQNTMLTSSDTASKGYSVGGVKILIPLVIFALVFRGRRKGFSSLFNIER